MKFGWRRSGVLKFAQARIAAEPEISARDLSSAIAREALYLEKVRAYDRSLFRANLLVAAGVFLAALCVYAFSLVPHAVPGPSADTLASALGLRGGLVSRHLVWRRLLGAVLACAPAQGAVLAANAFAMACSALGVALLYLVLAPLLLLCFAYDHFELALKRNPTRRLGFCAGADIVSKGTLDGTGIAVGFALCALGILAAYLWYPRKDIH